MLRLAADEDFNGRIVRGVLRRLPEADLLRIQEVGLSGAADQDVLDLCYPAVRCRSSTIALLVSAAAAGMNGGKSRILGTVMAAYSPAS